ncbi:hypothetical protein MT488_14625 [Enterobacter ludwigii]|uniref:hypothetical protein n=1 Tax=Enterobacter ludwigii TaxID=299767 RepID=UPI001FBA35F3|nr:hypothetical protein [Enterobacter ludwigii]UOH49837.1 hypothetical protein MT488_14625 [Enterobacter ludwigii]
MKFTLKEMNGLLNGKCLPSDLIVGETLAEYLVRKFSELEQRVIESERYGRQTDITIDNLEMKLAQMAAENAGLKAVCEDRRTFIMNGVQLGYIHVPTVETDPALETIRVAVSPQEPTPATDAFLTEVRASAIPEGYVLVPQQIFLDPSDIESICSQCGDGHESGYGEFTDGLLWVGNIQRDDGSIVHGLHISSADYSEDGGVTVCEFAAQLRQGGAV